MNDARRKEVEKAVALIEEAMRILEAMQIEEDSELDKMSEQERDGDEGDKVSDTVEALGQAIAYCDDAISACAEAT